jgi:hypothetical protein
LFFDFDFLALSAACAPAQGQNSHGLSLAFEMRAGVVIS